MRANAIICSLLAITASAAPACAQDTFQWSGRLRSGGTVSVMGITAGIEATPASGDQVEIVATGLDQGEHVEVVEHAGGLTFCVLHEGMTRSRRAGDGCEVDGEDVDREDRWHHDQVRIRVPAGAQLTAHSISGAVEVTGLAAHVEARSVSGNVRVSTRGTADAKSVSGNVDVEMGEVPNGRSFEFKSISGRVQVTLPAGAGAELRVHTLSGDIESDFPLESRDRGRGRPHVRVGSRMQGVIGDGGARIDLQTVSGDIRVRRR